MQNQTARIGACLVNRQSGRESRSLDSGQEESGDISVILAPSCFACQEGQDQEARSKNMSIMVCHCSHMVHEVKGGIRKKGRPGGEAPESHAQSATGPGHGSGHSLRQEIAQAKVKALQHIEVPTPSSSSTSSKTTKAQEEQQSQPWRESIPPMTESKIKITRKGRWERYHSTTAHSPISCSANFSTDRSFISRR